MKINRYNENVIGRKFSEYIIRFMCLLIFLFSAGCDKPEMDISPMDRLVVAAAENMEYKIRFDYEESCAVHSQKCFSDWMPSYLDPSDADTAKEVKIREQHNHFGCDMIRALQASLLDAEIKESENAATDEGRLSYMVRNQDGITGYFYRDGQMKILLGEDRYVYEVTSEAYTALLEEIDHYEPYGYYYMDQSIYRYLDVKNYDLVKQISLSTFLHNVQDGMSGIVLLNDPSAGSEGQEAVRIICQLISEQEQEINYIDMRNSCVDISCSVDLADGSEQTAEFMREMLAVLSPVLPEDDKGDAVFSLPLIVSIKDGHVMNGYAFSHDDWTIDETGQYSETAIQEMEELFRQIIAALED